MQNAKSGFIEFEAKFYPVDKDIYRSKLIKLGAKLLVSERKMRRAIVDSLVYPQFSCHYIRVRDEGKKQITFSAKTHAEQNGNIADQKEIVVNVSSYENTIKIIEAMGFVFTIYQENLRETWEYRGAEITIDTWPGLDPYSEIEAGSEEEVRSIAEKLGFNWEKRIISSVKYLYEKVYGLSREEVTQKLEKITFEENKFEGLPRQNLD